MKNNSPIMEYVWIGIALFSLFFALKITITNTLKEAYMFYLFALISVVLVLLRRKLRQQSNK